jgi:protease I
MDNLLRGRRIAFLMANEGVEQVELTTPWEAVREQGGTPELIAPNEGKVQAMNHLDKADTFTVDRALGSVVASDYDGAMLPGGVANPDELRLEFDALELLRNLFAAGKPVAAICHAPWTLVEAGLVAGRTLTSWPSLKTDIRNAGGTWVDEEVHVCAAGPNVLVSSRKPDDLDAFCREMTRAFAATPVAQGTRSGS